MTPAKYRRAVRRAVRHGRSLAMRRLGIPRRPPIFDPLGARVTRRTRTPEGVVRASRRLAARFGFGA